MEARICKVPLGVARKSRDAGQARGMGLSVRVLAGVQISDAEERAAEENAGDSRRLTAMAPNGVPIALRTLNGECRCIRWNGNHRAPRSFRMS